MGTEYGDRVIRRLREEGLKVTPQRIAVVKYLEGNRAHPSVEEIHREVSRDFPTISLATVYNTLDTLEQIGEVQAVTIDSARKHYDPEMRPHHHLMCTSCRCIQDVFADYASVLRVPDALARQFRVKETAVSFRGVCQDCAEQDPR
jgi:Fur family peroxide stress response transcriptional regulator